MARKKILLNVAANYFAVGVAILTQLLIIYFFNAYQGLDIYGEWVMIYTVPGYLSIAEFGVPAIMGTRMAKSYYHKYNTQFSLQLYSSLVVLSMNALIILFGYFLFWMLGVEFSSIKSISGDAFYLTLLFLIFYVFLCWICNFAESIYRAMDRLTKGVLLNSFIRILELFVPIYMLIDGGGVYHFALALMCSRFALTLLFLLYLTFFELSLISSVKGSRLRKHSLCLYQKGMAFMSFPLGNAALLQGVIVLVASAFGSTAVAIFSISRTLSRLLVQSSAAINKAFWPRLTSSAILGDKEGFNKYMKASIAVVSIYCILASTLVYFMYEYIVFYWTSGNAKLDEAVLLVLLFGATTTSIWQCYWVGLMSLERSKKFGYIFVLLSVVLICIFNLILDNLRIIDMAIMLVVLDMVLIVLSKKFLTLELSRRFYAS